MGRIADLDLQCHVADAEALLQFMPCAGQKTIVERSAGLIGVGIDQSGCDEIASRACCICS